MIEIWLSGRMLASLPQMHEALDAQDLIPSMALEKGKKWHMGMTNQKLRHYEKSCIMSPFTVQNPDKCFHHKEGAPSLQASRDKRQKDQPQCQGSSEI